jgi:hypothetical protein
MTSFILTKKIYNNYLISHLISIVQQIIYKPNHLKRKLITYKLVSASNVSNTATEEIIILAMDNINKDAAIMDVLQIGINVIVAVLVQMKLLPFKTPLIKF